MNMYVFVMFSYLIAEIGVHTPVSLVSQCQYVL